MILLKRAFCCFPLPHRYARDSAAFFVDFAAAFAKLLAFGTPGASTGLAGGLKAAVGL